MGAFSVKLRVGNLFSDANAEVEALVDTGATNSMMPGSLMRRLGIELETAWAQFAAEGRNAVARVAFGPEGEFLLGATTLEDLGVVVDPVDRRLIPQDDFLMATAA